MTKFARRVALAALLACALFGTVRAAIPTNVSLTILRTSSGVIDSRYPDGDDGTPAIPLAWATVDPISVLTTDTGSLNLCTSYLTQPAAPGNTADLAVETGYSLPTGFSLGGTHNCTLSWATPPATSTAVRIKATLDTFSVTSAEFQITVTAPAASDTTAPTIPTGIAVANGTGEVQITWDASSDPYVGEAGAGLQDYQVDHSVDGVRTVSASGGVQPQFALTNIGSLSPTPTAMQSGNSWTITSAGTIDGAASAFGFVNAPVTGMACVTGKIDSIVTGTNYAKFGLMVANSADAGSRYIAAYAMKNADGTLYLQVRRRQTDGANAGSIASITISALPVYVQICETASGVWNVNHSDTGTTWTADATGYSLPMDTTKLWGLVGTSTNGSGGATATGTVSQINLTSAGRVSYTYTTTHAGTIRIRARDADGNTSSYSSTVAVAPEAIAPTTAVRYHPGHYVWLGPQISNGNKATGQPTIESKLSAICSNTNIQGVLVMVFWAVMEPSAANSYDDTFLDAITTQAKACGKRVIVRIAERIFGGFSNIGTYYFPNYLSTNPTYNGGWVTSGATTWTGNLSAATRFWEAPVMDRIIALTKHVCQRAEANPTLGDYLEMIQLEETTAGVPSSFGFTPSAMMTQWKRWMDESRTNCPTMGFRMALNYTGLNNTETAALIQYAIDRDIAIGGPDPELPLPLATLNGTNRPRTIQGNRIMAGSTQVTCGSNNCWVADTAHDYRNEGVWFGEQEEFGLSGSQGYVETAQEIFDYQVSQMHARYITWLYLDYNTTGYTSPAAWAATILPAINANAGKASNDSGIAVAPASVPCHYSRGCDRD